MSVSLKRSTPPLIRRKINQQNLSVIWQTKQKNKLFDTHRRRQMFNEEKRIVDYLFIFLMDENVFIFKKKN